MAPSKRASPEMEAVLEKLGLSLIDLAKSSDEMARKLARSNYEPLPEDATLDEMEMAGFMRTMMDNGGIGD